MKRVACSIFLLALYTASAECGVAQTVTGSTWFGCSDREQFEKLVGYQVDRDRDAFMAGLTSGVISGSCVMFKDGERVFMTDTAMFSGPVRVRRQGETQEFWTNIEAVK